MTPGPPTRVQVVLYLGGALAIGIALALVFG